MGQPVLSLTAKVKQILIALAAAFGCASSPSAEHLWQPGFPQSGSGTTRHVRLHGGVHPVPLRRAEREQNHDLRLSIQGALDPGSLAMPWPKDSYLFEGGR